MAHWPTVSWRSNIQRLPEDRVLSTSTRLPRGPKFFQSWSSASTNPPSRGNLSWTSAILSWHSWAPVRLHSSSLTSHDVLLYCCCSSQLSQRHTSLDDQCSGSTTVEHKIIVNNNNSKPLLKSSWHSQPVTMCDTHQTSCHAGQHCTVYRTQSFGTQAFNSTK